MSKKNRYYSDIKIIKGKRSRFFKILGVLFFCGIFVLFSYSISLILGKTLNVSGGLIKSGVKNYYAISFGECDKNDALELSQKVVGFEGGGYIYEKSNKYYVLGAIYLNEKDAKNVVESNEQIENTEIIKIEIKNSQLSADKEINEKVFEIIQKLYENIINFENGKLNYIGLASKINELDGDCCVLLKQVDGEFSNKLIKIEKVLNNLTSTVLNNQMVNSCVKYSLIEIIDILSK